MGKQALSQLTPAEFEERIQARRTERMQRVDDMPADLRELVHDYGLNVVDTCMALGVTKARHIRHIVETVLDNFSPTRGTASCQGTRGTMDRPA